MQMQSLVQRSTWSRSLVLDCGVGTSPYDLIIQQLGALSEGGLSGGVGFVFKIAFIIIFVFNIGLMLISLVGCCCLGEDTLVVASLD